MNTQEIRDADSKLELDLDAYAKLQKIGTKLHRRYEAACNGDIDETETDAEGTDLVALKLEAKADDIAKRHGWFIYHQTDPRGCPIYISHGPIPENNYSNTVPVVWLDHLEDEDKTD